MILLYVICYMLYVQSLPNLRTRAPFRPKPLAFQHRLKKSPRRESPDEKNRREEYEGLRPMPQDQRKNCIQEKIARRAIFQDLNFCKHFYQHPTNIECWYGLHLYASIGMRRIKFAPYLCPFIAGWASAISAAKRRTFDRG